MLFKRHIITGIAILMLYACAALPPQESTPGIGPYSALTARLLVIEPTRRWQVVLDWQADSKDSGHARLTHAASGTVIELRWQGNDILLRDSTTPEWRSISTTRLTEHGIVISPLALSDFLSGRIPPGFRSRQAGIWENTTGGQRLHVSWDPSSKRLKISDMRHGREATLIILHGEPSLALTANPHD